VDGEILGMNWRTISPFTSREWGNPWIPGWKDGVRAEIWNQDLQNKRQVWRWLDPKPRVTFT